MIADVVIMPDGKVSIITREGTFAEGQQKVKDLMETLKGKGLEIEGLRFEQHRHEEGAHVHSHNHQEVKR